MEIVLRDFAYAIRQLKRSPAFTCAAVATLALGIGANTGIFSVVYGLLLESLPFRDAGRIVSILETFPQAPAPIEATYPDYRQWRAQQRSFEQLAAYSTLNPTTVSLKFSEHSEQVTRVLVSGNFFSLLGVSPILGRTLIESDDQIGSDNVAVLSTGAWRRYFGGDRTVIGRPIDINGSSFTIVGVLPSRAEIPPNAEVWLPLALLDEATKSSRVWHSVRVLGRLRRGVTMAEARKEMQTIAAQIARANPTTNRNVTPELSSLRPQLLGTIRPAILCVMGSVFLVLLIACVNVCNLMMVKAANLEQDLMVRQALGATRARLFSQFLTQSLLICFAGGLLGIGFADASLPLIRSALWHAGGLDLSMIHAIRLSAPALGLTLGTCVLTALIFGILPVLGIPSTSRQRRRLGNRTYTGAQAYRQNLMISGEISVAVTVLFLGSLMIRSFQHLLAVDSGYRIDHLLSFEITLPQPRFQDGSAETDRFFTQLLDQCRYVTGVVSAAATTQLPLSPSPVMTRFLIEGNPPIAPGAFPSAQIRLVTPNFFTTMGLGFLNGRTFTRQEVRDQANVFIVNQAFARKYLGDRNPIGAHILIGVLSPKSTSVPIIGIVSDAHEVGISAEPPPEVFLPGFGVHEIILVRTTMAPGDLIPVMRKTVHDLDPSLPIYHEQTIEEVLSASMALRRVTSALLAAFAFLALVLGAIGVYGILATSVVQRTREIGLRMAMGAQREDIWKLVMSRAFIFAIAGIVSGLGLGFLGARAINGLLFKTSTVDPLSVSLTICTLIAITAIAAGIPARRASMLNPMEALRAE